MSCAAKKVMLQLNLDSWEMYFLTITYQPIPLYPLDVEQLKVQHNLNFLVITQLLEILYSRTTEKFITFSYQILELIKWMILSKHA